MRHQQTFDYAFALILYLDKKSTRGLGAAAEKCGIEAVAMPILERCFTPGILSSDLVERCRQRLLADSVSGWAATWRAITDFDVLPRLREISAPTLMTTGSAGFSTLP